MNINGPRRDFTLTVTPREMQVLLSLDVLQSRFQTAEDTPRLNFRGKRFQLSRDEFMMLMKKLRELSNNDLAEKMARCMGRLV